ncbi:YbaY family lipoprotein [Shinella sp. CPCC 101442]|uniref:YbaY family lipoprotein n=1 Tax=Shinella sp. CPCC 101442 TaxID=2932265 RepID=UPI00215233B9|nr:YbaY family lipoprotein [Shinella sp. CPCC 101442]MCR6500881.1 YbaY family lipoprotein [Shinella sp. CPCC 101442]
MTNPTRRSFLAFIGAGLVASSAEASDSFVLSGTVTNVASGPVPVGRLTIRLEEQGIMDVVARRIAQTTVISKGNRHSIRFSMRVKRSALRKAVAPGFTIRLERDGRLIAINTTKQAYGGRGKASLDIEPILY